MSHACQRSQSNGARANGNYTVAGLVPCGSTTTSPSPAVWVRPRLVAAIPIVVLFFMLGVLRKPAWIAATSALGAAVVVALVVYGMPVQLALASTLYGAAFGIFPIAWIVFSSIMLYRAGGRHRQVRDHQGLGRRPDRTTGGCRRCSSPSRSARSSKARPASARRSRCRARCSRASASTRSTPPASACWPTPRRSRSDRSAFR